MKVHTVKIGEFKVGIRAVDIDEFLELELGKSKETDLILLAEFISRGVVCPTLTKEEVLGLKPAIALTLLEEINKLSIKLWDKELDIIRRSGHKWFSSVA